MQELMRCSINVEAIDAQAELVLEKRRKIGYVASLNTYTNLSDAMLELAVAN
jgi:hypothetical protein